MNAFDQDDPDSSQATQMIQDLLEPHTSPSKSGSTHNLRRRPQNQQPNDISADSLPSSRTSHSIPQYHFHGLASTQTQSQHYGEEDEPQEGSQKENIGAVKTGKESPPSRPASPGPSSSRNPPAKPQPAERRAPAAPSTDKGTSKKATNVTFQSPRPKGGTGASTAKLATRSPYKPTPPPVSRYKQPPRPPVRTESQDSFAYDPVGNEGRFIATAEQFAVPLSVLAKGSSPLRDSDTSGGTSLDSMYHRNTRQPARPPPPSPPRGRVLVEATPSQSTDSQQSQSQPAEPAEPARKSAFQRLFPNEPEIQPSFESGNLGHGRHAAYPHGAPGTTRRSASPVQIHPDLLATQSSLHDDPQTQPSHAPVETQPSTQFDDSRALEPDIEEGATPFTLAQPVLHSTGATGASRPRSLLDMVPPQNQWRYRHYGDAQNSMPHDQPAPTPSIPPSELQETQPSFEAPPPRRGFPTKSLTATTAPSAASLPSPIPIESMEVVPDSEPARRGIQASPKKASPKKPAAPPQKAGQVHPAEGAAGKGKAVAVSEDSEMNAVDEEPQRVADAEEEEEEEEEEEIPLAVVVAAPKKRGRPPGKKNANAGKGKGVAAPPPSVPAAAPKSKANPSSKTMQKPVLVPAMTGRSWENGEVPSSVPEQDLARNTRNTRNRPARIAEPKKKAAQKGPQSKQSSRSTSNAPRSVIQEEDEDAVIPSEHENDEGTEPADEEYQDADVGPSKKRKRASLGRTGVPVKGTRGGAAKRAKRPIATPVTRASVKPAASTATRSAGSKGSRVFALWIQDGHYYPGTVHSTDNQQRYNIKFDDGTESWVTIDDMRACELCVGDDVLHDDRNRPSAITNVDDLKDGTVEILVDDQAEAKHVSELRIAHKTVMFSWNDRRMTPQTVSTTVKPVKKEVSPSPSKMSMVSVPSVRGIRKKLFSRTALVVTLAAGKGGKEKESLMNAVKSSGGFVIDDLNTIIKMDGRHAAQDNRWTIRKADAKWIGNAEIGRLFLLADDANQKPKFLIALALGIPCLSTNWLEDSVECGKEREWAGYLLPQGYSTALGARASQQVDVDWGNSIYHVTDIMNNRVACKLFAGKSILCIGQDMVCHPKGNKRRAGSDDKTLDASNSVPMIILAMGAEVVEAITEPRHASQALCNFDYLVIREPTQYSPKFADCTVVHWAWVKDCLIASRYLPLPTWAGADESQ